MLTRNLDRFFTAFARTVSTGDVPSGSTMMPRLAGVSSRLSAWSVARTSKTCGPASRVRVEGEVHAVQASPSQEHSKVEPTSVAENEYDTVGEVTVPRYLKALAPLQSSAPRPVLRTVRRALGDRRILNELDAQARAGYTSRIARLAVTQSPEGAA